MGMNFERKLPIPQEVKKLYPLDAELEKIVSTRAQEISDIFTGKDDRLILVIGPCSADLFFTRQTAGFRILSILLSDERAQPRQ
ncbi:MAG: hypothetical protein IJD67_01290 [Clostridia bacterium]|nr:hypothetical protein [Clostridia bacterium]